MSRLTPLAVIEEAGRCLQPLYPREGGGVILTSPAGWRVFPLPNVSPNPETRFELEPVALLRALSLPGYSLAALFHSHCDCAPELSAADRHAAAPSGAPLYPAVSQLVISVFHAEARAFAEHLWTAAGWIELQRGRLPPR